MSKDLTISAKSFHDQVNTNQIGYKNESIGDSILPHLVKRARLNPTVTTSTKIYEVTENGETITEEVEEQAIEMRHYYSLHNDASNAIYVSPTIRLENSLPGGVHTYIPNKPDEVPEPDVLNPSDDPYIPVNPDNPNPVPGPSLPPGELIIPPILPPGNTDIIGPGIYDPSDSPIVNPEPGNGLWPNGPESNNGTPPTINRNNFTSSSTIIGKHNSTNGGGSWGGGGGGGGFSSTGGNSHNSTTSSKKTKLKFTTDFDEYADIISNPFNEQPEGVVEGYPETVTMWYHKRNNMKTAKEAMKKTRSKHFRDGWKINEKYAKLVYADSMYEESYISDAIIEIPKVISAPRMFANTPNLKTLKIINAYSLVNASEFCISPNLKTFSISNAKALTDASSIIRGCSKLTDFTLTNADKLPYIILTSLSNLKNVTISGNFSGTNGTLPTIFVNCSKLNKVRLTLKNTTQMSDIFDTNSRSELTEVYISAPNYTGPEVKRSEPTDGSRPKYTSEKLTLFTGSKKLKSVTFKAGKLKSTHNLFRDCTNLTELKDCDFASVLVAQSMLNNTGITSDKQIPNFSENAENLRGLVANSKICSLDVGGLLQKYPALVDAYGLAMNCKDLTTISNLDLSGHPNLYWPGDMFTGCNKLNNIEGTINLKTGGAILSYGYFCQNTCLNLASAKKLYLAFTEAHSELPDGTQGSIATIGVDSINTQNELIKSYSRTGNNQLYINEKRYVTVTVSSN